MRRVAGNLHSYPIGREVHFGRSAAFLGSLIFLTLQSPGIGVAQITASQITAIQGEEDPNRVESFHSPMMLAFPAPGLMHATSPNGWNVQGVQRFSCDGVYFSSLVLKVSGRPKKGVTIQAEGALSVGPSFDREAKVIVEIVADGKVLGRGFKEKIDAEERKVKPFRFAFKLSPEAAALLEKADHAIVRVTLLVWAA